MKQRRQVKHRQTELFFDRRPVSSPIPLDLPADREAELQRLIGELLLNAVRESPEALRGGDDDQ
jgi:hypothetical protein